MIPLPPLWICFPLLVAVTIYLLSFAGSYKQLLLAFAVGFFCVLSVPTVSSTLIGGGPARDQNNQIIKDSEGHNLYDHKYVRSYASATHSLYAAMYLGFALILASILVAIFKASTNAFGFAHPLSNHSPTNEDNT